MMTEIYPRRWLKKCLIPRGDHKKTLNKLVGAPCTLKCWETLVYYIAGLCFLQSVCLVSIKKISKSL